MSEDTNTERTQSAYTNQPIMGEEYVKNRDRREARVGRMIFYAFLACIVIAIIFVFSFGVAAKFR